MPPNYQPIQCPKKHDKSHDDIKKEYPDSLCCLFCGTLWPQPIDLSSYNQLQRSRTGAQHFGPRDTHHQRSQPATFPRTRVVENTYASNVEKAISITRGRTVKEEDPYCHPAGLPISIQLIASFGKTISGIFISSKAVQTRTQFLPFYLTFY